MVSMRSLLTLLAIGVLPAQTPYDTVIAGGRIVDGTGNAWYYGDVAIRGSRIVRVAPAGMLRAASARSRIDASGLVVAPGFIDIQSHSRQAFLEGDGRVLSKITQGITTEILGEGWTNAPANDKTMAAQGQTGRAPIQEFTGARGFDAWLRAMERHGTSANFGSFLGAATVRAYVTGTERGAPTKAEVAEMRRLVRGAMRDGAFGLASALIYPPGEYASTAELIEMAKEMSPLGGVYITHMRSEADRLLEAIDEALRIGREGGVPVEIYHLKAAGKRNWSKEAAMIAKIEEARRRGQDVSADMYAYTAGGTGLTACLPPWTAAGGKLFENVRNPEIRARIRAEIEGGKYEWENLCELSEPENVLIVGVRKAESKRWVGKRLGEIARSMGKNWIDAAMDLIAADETRVDTLFFMMSEENVKTQLRLPWIKFGTDAGGFDPQKATDMVHPRAYGNYPRILGKYVREEKVLPLEDAIRKMTSAVARRLSIQNRGLIQEGTFADIVIFDPATVIDRATFDNPHQLSTGIKHVLVNGVAVIRDGSHTGAKPGRVVRGPAYRER
jgi:dihydroorotase/N-acyl-D-amino-acid deacylase